MTLEEPDPQKLEETAYVFLYILAGCAGLMFCCYTCRPSAREMRRLAMSRIQEAQLEGRLTSHLAETLSPKSLKKRLKKKPDGKKGASRVVPSEVAPISHRAMQLDLLVSFPASTHLFFLPQGGPSPGGMELGAGAKQAEGSALLSKEDQ
ncbi:unnamed protein product [Chrysoparadoxa australica]